MYKNSKNIYSSHFLDLAFASPIRWRRQWQPTPVPLPGKIPWTEEPGGLPSMGSHRVGHD